jgi:hypothetical protein
MKSHWKVLAVVVLIGAMAPATAAAIDVGRPAGILFGRGHHRPMAAPLDFPQPSLQYFGGPVLHTNQTFVVFWDPSGGLSSGYRQLVVRYLRDVASDSGKTTNVYSVLNQYSDAAGPIRYQSTFAGSAVDTDPYPSGCPATADYPSCITDPQLAGELDQFLTAQDIARPADREFFVVTGPGLNTCLGSDGSYCLSPDGICAYHSDFRSAQGTTIYASISYAGGSLCDFHDYPNGSNADVAVADMSHEHQETIDDPLGSEATDLAAPLAWFDPVFGESADKCGAGPTRNNGVGDYSQVINGHEYITQMAWSNALAQAQGFGCVQNGADHSPAAGFVVKAHGLDVHVDGHLSTDPDPHDSILTYHWHFGDGATDFGNAETKHTYAAPGTYTVELYIVDQFGAEAYASHDVTVG